MGRRRAIVASRVLGPVDPNGEASWAGLAAALGAYAAGHIAASWYGVACTFFPGEARLHTTDQASPLHRRRPRILGPPVVLSHR
jgi:hypothetical protein